ncbi:transposase [Chryseobacterium carnipullorum]|uniref:transposase n=1 Tax=Chryseobacterium carnipullorum TaxID=1124835 RepID=UPI000E9FF219|nr:transposase [Chryseobacterium carnipullorum]HBV16398.1 transposase [Chryseobacterium carnipullorum]
MKQNSKENFKHIHIGKYLQTRVGDLQMSQDRIVNFLSATDEEIQSMYQSESIDSYHLLRWSKLLEYDFFRLYSQHLILYSAPSKQEISASKKNISGSLPIFRKHIYTKEIIDFILELINTKQKTRRQIITEYRIPKTTLYKWIAKYSSENKEY